MGARHKFCPQCRSEFQHWAETCSDCGCTLEAGAAPDEAAEPTAELPPPQELACLTVGDPWHLRELAEGLQRAGISSRIDGYPPKQPIDGPQMHRRAGFAGHDAAIGIYVLPAELEQARQASHAHMARNLPGMGEASAAASSFTSCPACGEALAEFAESCAACGLEFPSVSSECPSCQQSVDAEHERCPSCGAALDD